MKYITIMLSSVLLFSIFTIMGCSSEQSTAKTTEQTTEPNAKQVAEKITEPANKKITKPLETEPTARTSIEPEDKEAKHVTEKVIKTSPKKIKEPAPETSTKKVIDPTPKNETELAPEKTPTPIPPKTEVKDLEPATKKEEEPVKNTIPEPKPIEVIEPSREPAKPTEPEIQKPDAKSIIQKVDKNMNAKTQIITSQMVIYGKRKNSTISSKGYSEGNKKSFTEYLAPAREKGTKMLKLENRLWIYSPSTDRTIQLSGHMLRQSVMGSDLSYEDMMEDRKLIDIYDAKVIDSETIDGRKTWKIELNAKVEDVAYHKMMLWVDQERFVPLKEEMYAKSGQLLKKTTLTNVEKVDGRWYPKKVNYKDMLKSGKGTDFIIQDIQFDVDIPAHLFTKAALKK